MMMHGTFSGCARSEILFSSWSGARTAMYALILFFVFTLCLLVEWLSNCHLLHPTKPGIASGILRSLVHVLRMGLAYLAMLVVMSFDGGVFLAAVMGHAVGFLAFGKPGEAHHPQVGKGHRRSASRELLIRGKSEVGGEISDGNMMR